MTYYNYSPLTGEYLGTGTASPSPLEPGQYLIPSHATASPPPEAGEGNVPCWDGNTWNLIPDHRNQVWWDKGTQKKYIITDLGSVPSSDWTDQEPADSEATWNDFSWEISLESLKQRKIAQIRAEADHALKQIQANFSETEFLSWSKQESGAKELSINMESSHEDAQFVRIIAETRGISVQELVAKILGHIAPYAQALAFILGQQQRREDLALAARSVQEIDGI